MLAHEQKIVARRLCFTFASNVLNFKITANGDLPLMTCVQNIRL